MSKQVDVVVKRIDRAIKPLLKEIVAATKNHSVVHIEGVLINSQLKAIGNDPKVSSAVDFLIAANGIMGNKLTSAHVLKSRLGLMSKGSGLKIQQFNKGFIVSNVDNIQTISSFPKTKTRRKAGSKGKTDEFVNVKPVKPTKRNKIVDQKEKVKTVTITDDSTVTGSLTVEPVSAKKGPTKKGTTRKKKSTVSKPTVMGSDDTKIDQEVRV